MSDKDDKTTETPPPAPYQEGFLLTLVAAACAVLVWLFWPFLPALALAVVVATATYPLFQRLNQQFASKNLAALATTLAIAAFVITPLLYLLIAIGFKVQGIYLLMGKELDMAALQSSAAVFIERLPIPAAITEQIITGLKANLGGIVHSVQQGLVHIFGALFSNTISLVLSSTVLVFALYFFYRDGPVMAAAARDLSPLANKYDRLLMERFRSSASVLLVSTVAMAFAQGLAISAVTLFMDLPWVFLGVCTAVASFIPMVGTLLVWGPTAIYLIATASPWSALFLVIWGALIMGVIIDNFARPQLISWLARFYTGKSARADKMILDHTLLVFLTLLGGLIAFGVLGLLFGPLLGAMALSIFDVYEAEHGHRLERG